MKIEPLKNGKFCLLSDDGEEMGTFDTLEAAQKHYDTPNQGCPQMQPQLHNAKGFPEIYYARHMESGLCGYDSEKILVDADTMKKMAHSFAGKPVYVDHQDVNLKKLQEEADGYVADCFYNELDGWLWSKIIVVSDRGKSAVNKGWSVSNAYVPTMWSGGGSHHNVDYNRKMGEAEFTHLAIVPNPRYENAKIFTPEEYKNYCTAKRQQIDELRNSKGKPAMKFWKTEKKEVTAAEIDDDTVVELRNGKTITVREMNESLAEAEADPLLQKIARYEAIENAKKAKKNDKEGKEGVKDEDEHEEDGEEKMNAEEEEEYKRLSEKKNRMAKKNSEMEKDEKKNSGDPAPTAEELKAFEEMKNAKKNAKFEGPQAVVDLDVDQLARGKSRYGSTTK